MVNQSIVVNELQSDDTLFGLGIDIICYLAQLHEHIDDAQEIGRGQSGAGVTACHVVLIQCTLALTQTTPALHSNNIPACL